MQGDFFKEDRRQNTEERRQRAADSRWIEAAALRIHF